MRSLICLSVACVLFSVAFSFTRSMVVYCCVLFPYSQVASLWFLILYIKTYISSLGMHMLYTIFEMSNSLLPLGNLFAKLKQDMDPEWIFCFFSWNKSCCRGVEFLSCLVWPGPPQSGFWSLWFSWNLSCVKPFQWSLVNKIIFSFFPPLLLPLIFSLLFDTISQNLCKTRNKNNTGKAGGELLNSVSDKSHQGEEKLLLCCSLVIRVFWLGVGKLNSSALCYSGFFLYYC